ncbi:hypothetical protein E5F05_18755 [Deinococcus metallilatus]|uniref:Uncharacterized protein n=1 Tax=Deinococcus metallilatus TaxID=1211322 RepID=A0AAJ5F4N2_9DEIO|nr:hypothetical protein [Deinococcus metallilatus]MBB5296152.1 hypothetical protein [Deinococcus metallilatus]QBY09797.1 hypothetical protein E5F05_18755 [Deinococcus metallilatus]RXJ08795.1 hypothetical protein ERJ73_17595 [Deinococcus metallilatus]TLK23274.1 hypothetical protein FCS05_16185 [Deinococcus metallilatus]GMA14018.1 hypothetical protein GCM10025871_03490 [Deinococcus metallilatus]
MADTKREDYLDESDLDQNTVIEEGMQGATGDMDADGLEKNFDRQEKLSELRENLQDVTAPQEDQRGNA